MFKDYTFIASVDVYKTLKDQGYIETNKGASVGLDSYVVGVFPYKVPIVPNSKNCLDIHLSLLPSKNLKEVIGRRS